MNTNVKYYIDSEGIIRVVTQVSEELSSILIIEPNYPEYPQYLQLALEYEASNITSSS